MGITDFARRIVQSQEKIYSQHNKLGKAYVASSAVAGLLTIPVVGPAGIILAAADVLLVNTIVSKIKYFRKSK